MIPLRGPPRRNPPYSTLQYNCISKSQPGHRQTLRSNSSETDADTETDQRQTDRSLAPLVRPSHHPGIYGDTSALRSHSAKKLLTTTLSSRRRSTPARVLAYPLDDGQALELHTTTVLSKKYRSAQLIRDRWSVGRCAMRMHMRLRRAGLSSPLFIILVLQHWRSGKPDAAHECSSRLLADALRISAAGRTLTIADRYVSTWHNWRSGIYVHSVI